MALENYVGVMPRVKQFREDNKDKKVLIDTEVFVNFDKEAAYFKATITVDGVVVAKGHAMAPALGDDKEFEKAETSAVGRALAFLGYEADAGDAEPKSEKKSSKGGLGGLGSKKSSKKVEKEEEESEESEEESEEAEEKEEKPAKKGLPSLGKKAASKKDEEEESEESEDEESEDESEEESEEEEEKEPAKKSAPAGASKLSGVMAKYGLKKP